MVQLRYQAPAISERWVLPEGTVPETYPHDRRSDVICRVLRHRLETPERGAMVCRNLAIRYDAGRPQLGFDPDVCLLEPAPPEGAGLRSLRLWEAGHHPPRLCIEVVSETHPYKDYSETPRKCAGAGVEELLVFDPLLAGPQGDGGPHLLQLWRRTAEAAFERVHAGDAPVFSQVLAAWFVVVSDGEYLRVAEDAAGEQLWLTRDEAEHAEKERALAEKERALAEKEQERAEKEQERAEKERALSRIAELEAELAAKGRG
jgi:hypothetical protein